VAQPCGHHRFVASPPFQAHKDFFRPSWDLQRLITFSITLGFGIVPVMHWSFLTWDNPDEVALFLPRVVIAYTLMFLGATFYVSRYAVYLPRRRIRHVSLGPPPSARFPLLPVTPPTQSTGAVLSGKV
jgi:hypothetical protein